MPLWYPRDFPPVKIHPQVRSLLDGQSTPLGASGKMRGPNLLVDGDMEAAGVAAWTAFAATLSKSAVSPHTGAQSLSLAITAATGIAYQSPCVAASSYRLTGWARGNGATSHPRLRNGAATLWTGTTSTSWQAIDVSFVAGAASIRLDIIGNIGDSGQWDDVYLSAE